MRESSEKLARILAAARPSMESISDAQASEPVLKGGWSSKQVLGHLIDSASNNHQRFVRTAIQGGLEFPGYDQAACVRVEDFQQAPWNLLIEVWSTLNRLLSHILAHLPPEAAAFKCRVGAGEPQRLDDLARDYITHMSHHLAQLGIAAVE